jgi:hypothetical protein
MKKEISHSFEKPNYHLGIHFWKEVEGRKALSIFWGLGLLTIYY